MTESDAIVMLAALEAALDRPFHELLGIPAGEEMMSVCVAFAAAAATYNPVHYEGMAPALVQRATFAYAKLRTKFAAHVAEVQNCDRARRSTRGRLHGAR